jgi:threonine aldolase
LNQPGELGHELFVGEAIFLDQVDRHQHVVLAEVALELAEGLAAAGYRVINDVVLNQVLVSFGSPERTREVIARLQADGTCWCGGTVWQGRTAMRISVCSWATTEDDVERSLEAMLRAAGG